MSRIHEALRKAAQERASIPTPDPSGVLLEGGVATTAPAEAGAVEMPAAVPPPIMRAGDLQFGHLLAQCARPKWHADSNVIVFANSESGAEGAEQFRTLRSRLYQLRSNQSLHTLLVTSAIPGEGKTFVAHNLAQAIVRQSERRALLIDADLRRPRMHLALGAPSAPGLSDYLRGTANEMEIIQHGQEGNLCFIPGGNQVTNPSELLLSGGLKSLLERLTPTFDWIILDSPPCVPVADAHILADVCDGVLLVVRSGATRAEVAHRASQELKGRNVVGVVLNAVDKPHLRGSLYYYQGSAYHYDSGRPGSNGA